MKISKLEILKLLGEPSSVFVFFFPHAIMESLF